MRLFLAVTLIICSILVAYSVGRQQAFHDMNRTDLAYENLKLNKQIMGILHD